MQEGETEGNDTEEGREEGMGRKEKEEEDEEEEDEEERERESSRSFELVNMMMMRGRDDLRTGDENRSHVGSLTPALSGGQTGRRSGEGGGPDSEGWEL